MMKFSQRIIENVSTFTEWQAQQALYHKHPQRQKKKSEQSQESPVGSSYIAWL
jgi:hypothetical protein